MKILVFIRDGRTVYKLARRSDLAKLVGAEPWGEHEGVTVERAHWNAVAGEFGTWTTIKVRFISKGSIATVEEVPREAGA